MTGGNKFIFDFDPADWEQVLFSEESDTNFSKNQFLFKIDNLLQTFRNN